MKSTVSTTKSVSHQEEVPERKVRQYRKLTQAVKKQLVQLIIRDNFSIRKAAKQLNINYSSAKIILAKYRLKQRMSFIPQIQPDTIVEYKDVPQGFSQHKPILLFSYVGGRYESQNSQFKKIVECSSL